MTLATYHKYVNSVEGQSDDAPLAMYDSQLDTDDRRIILDDDYHVPKCFAATDLLECLDEIHNQDDGDDDTVDITRAGLLVPVVRRIDGS
jgi:hypothetical protein